MGICSFAAKNMGILLLGIIGTFIKVWKEGEDGNWSHVVKSYEFSKEDIEQVKQYVKDNGLGNSKNNNTLLRFTAQLLIGYTDF